MLMNMADLLAVANKENFAIPAFNVGTGQFLKAIIEVCEEKKSPVILAIHPNPDKPEKFFCISSTFQVL